MLIPRVPLPLMLDSVTVRVVPLPVTARLAEALPVAFRVMLVGASVLEAKFASA